VKILTLPRHFFKKPPDKRSSIKFLVSILKKRTLVEEFSPEICWGKDEFVLEQTPDILISNLDESSYKNYKGTTLISNSESDKVFSVDLKTRGVEEIVI
jgi:hypothetical protein